MSEQSTEQATEEQSAAEQATEEQPAAVRISVLPTEITGTAGQPVSGHFAADGGTGPYKFVATGAVGIAVAEDGFFAGNPTEPESGDLEVIATDVNGVHSEPTTVHVTIN